MKPKKLSKEDKDSLEYRMYGLTPYNISPIQQGIQFGHAVVEYLNDYHNTPECKKWRLKDKTFIILNGGTTNIGIYDSESDSYKYQGTLNKHLETLESLSWALGSGIATFHEPDLGDQLTAVVFLVDERVWDKEKYPDFKWKPRHFNHTDEYDEAYEEWVESVGGKGIVAVREFLKQFRLA